MEISLSGIGKRYRYEWIFRNIDYQFEAGERYGVTGSNGSGKSTFLRILSGHLTPSKGKTIHKQEGKKLSIDDVYKHVSYAAPYIDLIEELTLPEALRFHARFKPFLQNLTSAELMDLLAFQKAKYKQIRNYSSGMKQRLKLLLAICSDSSLLLLDEPTITLDVQGIDWYQELMQRFALNRTVIIASNVAEDLTFCNHRLSIEDYKPQASKKF